MANSRTRKWSKAQRAKHSATLKRKAAEHARRVEDEVSRIDAVTGATRTAHNKQPKIFIHDADVVFPPRTEEEKVAELIRQVKLRTIEQVSRAVFTALDAAFDSLR